MTRDEAIDILKGYKHYAVGIEHNGESHTKAFDMAITALSKPNYETDTEVRLVVTDRHKDKVVLFDAFGEVEYLPTEPMTHEEAWKQTDLISRDMLVSKLKRRKKFFIDAWGSFHLLSITDRARVDELDACIAEITNAPTIAEKHQLSEETPTNTPTDLISRAEAMGAVQDHFNADGFKGYDDGQKMMDRIKALPSVSAERGTCYNCEHWNAETHGCKRNPSVEAWNETDYCSYYSTESAPNSTQEVPKKYPCEPKRGEWIDEGYEMKCSVCDADFDYCDNDCNRFVYCPNCGAKMGVSE